MMISDQVHERLMLGASAVAAEERVQVKFGHMTPGGNVCFVPDEYVSRLRIAAYEPPIAVGAGIDFSRFGRHARVHEYVCQPPGG